MAAIPPPDYNLPPAPISVEGGTLVTDFDEYTFHAPRPGFFVGDSRMPDGGLNPVTEFCLEDRGIPACSSYFNRLPIEISEQILIDLDICSLIAFRSANQRIRKVVDSMKDFQLVAAFPRLLGAIVQLQARFFSLKTLSACISDPACRYCGHFGDLLYLITAERWCYLCRKQRHELEPVLAKRECPPDALSDIPHLSIIPGFYGWAGRAIVKQPRLVFDQRAFVAKLGDKDYSVKIKHRDTSLPHPLRFLAIIRAPYFDKSTQSFEEGFCCRACAHQGWEHCNCPGASQMRGDLTAIWEVGYRKYTRDGMNKHLNEHGAIYRLEGERIAESTVFAGIFRLIGDQGGVYQYVHKHPFPRWSLFSENANELVRIHDLLRDCRDKKIEVHQLQPYLPDWYSVSSSQGVSEGLADVAD